MSNFFSYIWNRKLKAKELILNEENYFLCFKIYSNQEERFDVIGELASIPFLREHALFIFEDFNFYELFRASQVSAEWRNLLNKRYIWNKAFW